MVRVWLRVAGRGGVGRMGRVEQGGVGLIYGFDAAMESWHLRSSSAAANIHSCMFVTWKVFN